MLCARQSFEKTKKHLVRSEGAYAGTSLKCREAGQRVCPGEKSYAAVHH